LWRDETNKGSSFVVGEEEDQQIAAGMSAGGAFRRVGRTLPDDGDVYGDQCGG
jgi:hypothetical protein